MVVGGHGERQDHAAHEGVVERGDGVRRQAGEQRPRARVVEPASKATGGAHAPDGKAGGEQRMRRPAENRSEDVGRQLVPPAEERAHEPFVCGSVRTERGRGVGNRMGEDRGAAVSQRVRHRDVGLDPLQAVLGERKGAQRRRPDAMRVDGRAHVVAVTGERQLFGRDRSTEVGVTLENLDLPACLGEVGGGDEAVMARADDDRVGCAHR